jgi:hypothetical protein
MSSEDASFGHYLDVLRRDGSVVVRFATAEEAAEWRAAIRKAARGAGLRVRTGVVGEGEVAWAHHVDHVVTDAEMRAASRVMGAALTGDSPPAPFHELVRQEQRKMLRVVPPDNTY